MPRLADQFRLPYLMDIRPSSEFSYEGGKSKLVNLNIGSDDGPRLDLVVPGDVHANDGFRDIDDEDNSGTQSRLLRLSGWIDMNSRITVWKNVSSAQLFVLTKYRLDVLGH